MSPKKRSRRGGRSGRGRGITKKTGQNNNGQPLGPDDVNAEEADGDESSTDIPFKHLKSPVVSPKPRIEEIIEEKELSLPQLKPSNIAENSMYLSLLTKEKKPGYLMTDDELDHLQWDLESMLTAIIVRKQTIKDELVTFSTLQIARSQQKRSKGSRYPKIRPRAAAEISPVNECLKLRVEIDPSAKELPPSKNDSANKFWTLVEPYVAPIEKDDLNWLEDLVKSYSSNLNLFEIPPLGEHYTKQWAKEEMELQKSQSSCSPRPAKRLKLAERVSPEVVELVNKVNYVVHDGCSYTPLLQRLTAALVEETPIPLEDIEEELQDYDDSEEKLQDMSNVCTEFYAEQSIRKQLIKLGLLGRNVKIPPPSSTTPPPLPPQVPTPPPLPPVTTTTTTTLSLPNSEDYDEVLEELKKCEASLIELRAMNKEHLTQLWEKCRQEYCRQIVKIQLEKVNDEILHFKREKNESLTKAKKITQIRKEDEQLSLLLQQRSDYLRQLQMMGPEPGYHAAYISDDSELSEEGLYPSSVFIKSEPDEEINEETSCEQLTEADLEQPAITTIKQEIVTNDGVEKDDAGIAESVISEPIIMNGKMENNEIVERADDDKSKIDNSADNISDQDGIYLEGIYLETDTEFKEETRVALKRQGRVRTDLYGDLKRDLRPRRGRREPIYFEPYDGDSSETDFSELSD
ncbi:transcriptional adapter 3 isoform X2 [Adelges cooleyi]|uniref:transcriptional adapter 3 isoform X2 n=1 Tax=Adelges cooleyi TaxID=133065 RepID=UPI00217FBCFD|nr:transcriptional adapter 3 isoform X2 [Adelges cooleyi]